MPCVILKRVNFCRSRLEFKDVRGMEGVKETVVNLAGNKLRIAVVN